MTISVLVVQDHTTTLEGWRVLIEACKESPDFRP